MPCSVLDLFALRPRSALLQCILPGPGTPATTTACQPPSSAESRGTSRSSRQTARVPASSQTSRGRRDGSGFRFDLFAAQYSFMGIEISHHRHQESLGNRFCVHAGVAGVAQGVGPTAPALSWLYPVWPAWSFRRSVSQDPTILGCRDDQRRNPCAGSSSVLRRTLEDRHDCP